MKKLFLFLFITPLASQELVDVLWDKKNLTNPYNYNELSEYIEGGSEIISDFNGRISLTSPLGNGFTILVDDYNIFEASHKKIPEFSIEIYSKNNNIIPSNTGLIKTSHPFWDIQFGIGKAYYHKEQSSTVLLMPFSLMHKNANCVHTGVSIFALDQFKNPSNIIFQIASETCAYYKFDYVSIYKANYEDLPLKDSILELVSSDQISSSFDKIYDSHQIKSNSFGDSNSFKPQNMTLYGLIDGNEHFQSPCITRLGNNIFCSEVVLPSYSLAKSIAGTLSLALLAKKYKDISQLNVSELVPQCKDRKWSNITIEDLSDMSTGQYFSSDHDYDESSIAMTNFLFTAETHKEKLAIACDAFPRKRKPGKTFVYHTSDTYLLGSALNNFLTENTNDSDYFIDLLNPFLKLYGLSSISQHSLRTNDETLTPYTGFGMYFNSNDLFQLSQILHSFKNNSDPAFSFLYNGLNPSYENSLAAIKRANIYYNNGFWSKVFDKDIFGCQKDVWIPFMSGFGGITFALLPNGMSYYYFSDGYVYSWEEAVVAAHTMRPFC
ncbi:beta-lactamase family protein [Gammaproteobacteria bacterium]|nr:beta-lactamase family protein [Gammaproteobacteria bacterium]